MSVQVLVAAMHQKNHDLLKKMNIRSDAIVANQCDVNSVEEFEYNGYKIKYLNFLERGVGLNRNNSLMRATADYCLFADDDMVYKDNYVEIIENAFNSYKDADVIIFNLEENDTTDIPDYKKRKMIVSDYRVNYFNFLRFGTARIAIRTKAIQRCGIFFNHRFGGGTEYCHGEDNLFIASCLKCGLKIYAVPITIACLTDERVSTWNNGFNEKYVSDQGALYRCMSRRYWRFLCFQDVFRRHKSYGLSIFKAYSLMKKGARSFRSFK